MRPTDTANWIRLGLFALPLYGVLTFWSSLDRQPDPNTHYEAWSHSTMSPPTTTCSPTSSAAF